MKFKNLNTGLVWEVEGALAERLAKDIDYKKIEEEAVDGENNSSELKDDSKGKKSKKEGE